MRRFIDRLILLLIIMISITLLANYNLGNNKNEIYYDNFRHTNNVELSEVDGFDFDYSATLENVGDYYEIDFDVVNTTDFDIEIDELDIHEDDQYVQYRLAYEDGDLVNVGDKIKNGESKTLRYIVLYKSIVLDEDYHFDSSFNINYKQTF